jgi:hypothetical protein
MQRAIRTALITAIRTSACTTTNVFFSRFQAHFFEVFRIRDILVRIQMRIRILGFEPLTNGCRSVPKYSVTFRMQKIKFKSFKIVKILFLQPLFQSAQHFYQKREGSVRPKTYNHCVCHVAQDKEEKKQRIPPVYKRCLFPR